MSGPFVRAVRNIAAPRTQIPRSKSILRSIHMQPLSAPEPIAPVSANRSSIVACFSTRSGHAGLPEVAIAVERQISRDDHQFRRRLQPLEGSGGDPMARGQPHATAMGLIHVTSATCRKHPAASGPAAYQPALKRRRKISRRSFRPGQGRVSPPRSGQLRQRTLKSAVSPEDDIELRRVHRHQPVSANAPHS